MSMGPLGIVGSAAGSQLSQAKGTDSDRVAKEVSDQSRKTDGASKAQAADGVGQTDEQEQTSERDADGRRLWEKTGGLDPNDAESGHADERPPTQSKDAIGQSGNRLDLSG